MSEALANSLEKKEDIGTKPSAVAKRWKLELKLAAKRESKWREKVADIYRTYTPETAATNSFNILWTNTETLRQAVYNSLPQPDVRRRYQDEDPLGKCVGDVLTRALEFSQDTYDFDAVLKGDVLSMLLAGRSISRVRYVPDIKAMGGENIESDADTQESESYEEIAWEQTICERVQWDDFRILCAAKTWDEVCAIGFRHRLTREDCVDKFGEEVGNAIPLDAVDDEDVKKSKDVADLFKTAEVWEIWDKDEKQVVWICPTYPTPAKTQEDPLKLSGFFPIPRPLYAIENDQTLLPTPLYSQYEQQAKELNKVSIRINKLIDTLKVRGIYDATLTELSELMKANDGDLVAAANATALIERGGIEKAIWMMPIDAAAMVLKELYAQREAVKQVIYEITGISDILRAATNANETYGAQKIKAQWGSQRLQRMQIEVQRYIRDLIRLKAEIIAEKFQIETLEKMTLLKYPHREELQLQYQQQVGQYQQAMMQYQQVAMQAQQSGQKPPPAPQPPQQPTQITWEDVQAAMQDDATRTYRVDIETDSTLSASQDGDMTALKDVLTTLGGLLQGMQPAIQSGLFPVEALKAMIGVIVRRAKMGTAVEDALEKMQAPNPASDPAAQKAQADQQAQQAKQQHDQQMQQMKDQSTKELETFKAQLADQQHQRELQADTQAAERQAQIEAQLQAHEQEVQAKQNEHQNQLEAQRAQAQAELDAQLEAQRQASEERMNDKEAQLQMALAQLERLTKLEVAEIGAQTTLTRKGVIHDAVYSS